MISFWEEVTVEPNTVIETEATSPTYMWLILEGEVSVFKRPESIYDENGNLTDVKEVALFPNPVDSNSTKLGIYMGGIMETNLLADDAIVFG